MKQLYALETPQEKLRLRTMEEAEELLGRYKKSDIKTLVKKKSFQVESPL